MRIAFRADASVSIGTGHVVRCATLAEELRRRGAEVVFLCRPLAGNLIGWLQQRGIPVRVLGAPEDCSGLTGYAAWLGVPLAREMEQSGSALAEMGPVDWLVVDHYALDVAWESVMRRHCERILVIDDLADRDHECDALLDQNLIGESETRYATRLLRDCRRMVGPRFALLQPEFVLWRERISPRTGSVRRLLVFFGGVDSAKLTSATVSALAHLGRTGIAADVVIGAANPQRESLERIAAGAPSVRLHFDLPSLAPLMAAADVAVGAGGATSWERCCLGIPSLIVTVSANQEPIAQELDARGLARWLGKAETLKEQDFIAALGQLLDTEIDSLQSRRCMAAVDGRGATRVASALYASSDMELRLRDATLEDESLFLEWANDSLVRQHAFSTAQIEPGSHGDWFRARLTDRSACRMYVAEDSSGIPVGQVRFEHRNGHWLIGYSLDTLFRGHSLGQRLLAEAMVRLVGEIGDCEAVGRVKNDNVPSLRVFSRLGFSARDVGGNVTEFSFALSATTSMEKLLFRAPHACAKVTG